MPQDHCNDLIQFRSRRQFSRFKKGLHPSKDPGIPLCAPCDHEGITPGFPAHPDHILRVLQISVSDHRDPDALLYFPDDLPISSAAVILLSGTAMNGDCCRAGLFRDMCDLRGVSVAVVAFTKGMDGLGLPSGSEDCVNLLYKDYDTTYRDIDKDGIRSVLRAAQSEQPDITIAMLHWGSAYNDGIFETQEDIVDLMMDEGVDIILGTHPHYLHKVEFDDVNNTLIAYSLGDFFGDASKSYAQYSIILDIEISKDNDSGETEIVGYSVTPIYTLKESETQDGHRRVVRLRDAMAAYDVNFVDRVTSGAYQTMEQSLEFIDNRLNPKKED